MHKYNVVLGVISGRKLTAEMQNNGAYLAFDVHAKIREWRAMVRDVLHDDNCGLASYCVKCALLASMDQVLKGER